MLTALVLVAALGQVNANPPSAPSPGVKADKPEMSERRQREIEKTIARQRARKAGATAARQLAIEETRAQAIQMAPILQAQNANEIEAARLRIQAQQAGALSNMATAQRQQAATNQAMYRIYSQQAGVPQIYEPGVGLVPYAGGIANPLPQILPVAPGFVGTLGSATSAAATAAAAAALGGTPLPTAAGDK